LLANIKLKRAVILRKIYSEDRIPRRKRRLDKISRLPSGWGLDLSGASSGSVSSVSQICLNKASGASKIRELTASAELNADASGASTIDAGKFGKTQDADIQARRREPGDGGGNGELKVEASE